MADSTQDEKKIEHPYTYIDTDIDRDLLVTNLKHNARGYADHKKMNDQQRQEFDHALNEYIGAIEEGRISSSQMGDLVDSAGILDNGETTWTNKRGKQVDDDRHNRMLRIRQKRFKGFSPNRQVANFVDQIARSLLKDQKKQEGSTSGGSQDTSKKALDEVMAAFMRHEAPGGHFDFDAWYDLDDLNEKDQTRGVDNRLRVFVDFLNNSYMKSLDNIDWDKEDGFTSKDDFISRMNNFIADLQDGVIDSSDSRALQRVAGNSGLFKKVFETKFGKELTEEQKEQQKEKQKEIDKQKEIKAEIDKVIENGKNGDFEPRDVQNARIAINSDAKESKEKYDSFMTNSTHHNLKHMFSPQALRNVTGDGLDRYCNIYQQYYELLSEADPEGSQKRFFNFQGAGNWIVDMNSFNYNNGTVIAFDPYGNKVRRCPLWKLGKQAVDIMNSLYYQRHEEGDSTNWWETGVMKEGGRMIRKAEEGDELLYDPDKMRGIAEFVSTNNSTYDRDYNASVARTSTDSSYNRPFGEESDYGGTEITGAEKARLASLVADIGAIVAPGPVSIGASLASTALNLGADIAEGESAGTTAMNALINGGLTVASVIPVFGGMARTGRVIKTLTKLAPTIMGLLSAKGLYDTMPEAWASLSKLNKEGVENEMNLQDWKNILRALTTTLGVVAGAKRLNAGKIMREAGKSEAQVVHLKDNKTGQVKEYVFSDKKTAEALKNAKSKEDVEKVVHNYKSLKNKEVVAQDSHTGLAENKSWKPSSWFETKQQYTSDYYDIAKARKAVEEGTLPGVFGAREAAYRIGHYEAPDYKTLKGSSRPNAGKKKVVPPKEEGAAPVKEEGAAPVKEEKKLVSRKKKENKPEEKATGKPEEKATGKPEEKATGKPEEKATGKSEEKTTSGSEEKATGKPEEKKLISRKEAAEERKKAEEKKYSDKIRASEEERKAKVKAAEEKAKAAEEKRKAEFKKYSDKINASEEQRKAKEQAKAAKEMAAEEKRKAEAKKYSDKIRASEEERKAKVKAAEEKAKAAEEQRKAKEQAKANAAEEKRKAEFKKYSDKINASAKELEAKKAKEQAKANAAEEKRKAEFKKYSDKTNASAKELEAKKAKEQAKEMAAEERAKALEKKKAEKEHNRLVKEQARADRAKALEERKKAFADKVTGFKNSVVEKSKYAKMVASVSPKIVKARSAAKQRFDEVVSKMNPGTERQSRVKDKSLRGYKDLKNMGRDHSHEVNSILEAAKKKYSGDKEATAKAIQNLEIMLYKAGMWKQGGSLDRVQNILNSKKKNS